MRLFSYFDQNGQRAIGALSTQNPNRFIPLSVSDPSIPNRMLELIEEDPQFSKVKKLIANPQAVQRDLDEITFATLIDRPGKIICMGLNYADHAKEGGHARPDYPSFFMRGPSSVTAHQSPIIRPKVSTKLDYEAELAFVISKQARHCTLENALEHLAGYSIFNDGSVRDYQRKSTQWTIGKNFDQTGGFGPVLVTADELPAGATDLKIQSRLNGQVMQDANTRDMIWGVAETIQLLTECMTLEPGDLIIMGTPAGVGQARTPPVWMKHGDVVEIEIEHIGLLRNKIQREVV